MGRVIAPYGVLGWVKIHPDTEALDGLLDYKTWWLGRPDDWQEFRPEKAKIHNDVLLVKLQGVDDRDQAFALKGSLVAVPRAWLPATEENEYYWSDLIGLEVKNLQGITLGKVTELFETGANDVMVVKAEAGEKRERLIPFIAQTVLDVDLQKQVMSVDWDEDF